MLPAPVPGSYPRYNKNLRAPVSSSGSYWFDCAGQWEMDEEKSAGWKRLNKERPVIGKKKL